jgi:hypothetical protein
VGLFYCLILSGTILPVYIFSLNNLHIHIDDVMHPNISSGHFASEHLYPGHFVAGHSVAVLFAAGQPDSLRPDILRPEPNSLRPDNFTSGCRCTVEINMGVGKYNCASMEFPESERG